jgi:outer membrane protein assembly factor BamB
MKRMSARVTVGILLTAAIATLGANDWPEWRGPNRDGTSAETNLPARWSPAGENLAWSLPFGGRSTPVIFGNRLYLQTTTTGDISKTQERLVAIDVDSGKVVWERRASVYLSDVPQGRAAWASPSVDPATGNIYMFTVAAELFAFAPDGKVLWDRSLPEEYGAITTHGGRTTSPIIEDDKIILNALIQNWGPDLGRPGNRYFAFDKRTGQTIWVSSPQARHYDTNYSTPIVATVDGSRLLIVGGTDGVFHALQVNTGKPVWSIEVSKRAILNSVLFRDNTVYVTHGEENIDTTEMGMVAAVDATGSGRLTGKAIKWVTRGFLPTFASPVMDAERLYAVDNSAILGAFDLKTGKELWTKRLGIEQRGSPVLADGKLYVGTNAGKFYILRPTATTAETLDEDQIGTANNPEPIVASPAIADGRVYVVTLGPVEDVKGSSGHVYAIGTRRPRATSPASGARGLQTPGAAGSKDPASMSLGTAALVQVFPNEALLDPNGKQAFSAKLFDAKGNLLRTASASDVQWTLDLLQGTVGPDGTYVAPASGGSAGFVKATVGGVSGQARVRVIPPLPQSIDFEGIKAAPMWWTANLKGTIGQIDGNAALTRPRDDTVGRRARFIMGRPDWSNYTVEADVRGLEMRRQRGDVGLINQRYVLVLFGNTQRLELHPWQAADEMTVQVPFKWDLNMWYRMKLRVENRKDGTTLVQGKVWLKDQPEPTAWTIQKTDTIPHRKGAPGLYGDGISDVFFDNVRVYRNQ